MRLPSPEPPLADGVVQLRPWLESDLPALERASADEYVAMIEHVPRPFTEAAGRAWIAARHALLDDETAWNFAIVELASSEAVGGAGLRIRHVPGTADAGVWVLPAKRNRGLAGRAIRLLCSWALTSETSVARIQATVEPWNVAAQRVLESIGFVHEGRLRAYASYGGDRRDVLMYSLLASDLGG